MPSALLLIQSATLYQKKMTNPIDLQLQEVISRLNMVHDAINKKVLSNHGLRRARFFTLQALHIEPGLTLGELSDKILVDRASASRMVFSMEKEMLVQRVISPEDRRQFTLSLTDAGEALYQKAQADFEADIHERFDALDPETKETLLTLSLRLEKALNEHHAGLDQK